MARIQKIELDSSYSNAPVRQGQILTYKIIRDGQVVYRAKLSDGTVVDIGTANQVSGAVNNAVTYQTSIPLPTVQYLGSAIIFTGTSSIFVTGHTYMCVQRGGAYIWLDVSPIVQLADMGVGAYVSFTDADLESDSCTVTFNIFRAPTGIMAASGKYYPIQKAYITMHYPQSDNDAGYVKIDIAPYLAYQNRSLQQGIGNSPWFCLFAGGGGNGGDVQLALNNYYTKSNVKSLLSSKLNTPKNSYNSGYVLHIDGTGSPYWNTPTADIPIQSYWNSAQVYSQISAYTNKKLVDSYYTSLQVRSIISAISDSIERINTRISEVNNSVSTKLTSPTNTYSSGYVMHVDGVGSAYWQEEIPIGSYWTSQQVYSQTSKYISNQLKSYYTSQYISNNYVSSAHLTNYYGISDSRLIRSLQASYMAIDAGGGFVSAYLSSNFGTVIGEQVSNVISVYVSDYMNTSTYIIPQSGSTGAALVKTSTGIAWSDIIPRYGVQNTVLTKTAQGVSWAAVSALPAGGSVGQVLTKIDGGATWSNISALPEGGSSGDVLTKIDSDGTVSWAPGFKLPTEGNDGDVLTKTSQGTSWATISGLPTATDADLNKILKVGTNGVTGWAALGQIAGEDNNILSQNILNAVSISYMQKATNSGATGDVLYKTTTGTSWGAASYISAAANIGATGDVLYKTTTGTSWGTPTGKQTGWYTINCSGKPAIKPDRTNGEFQSTLSITNNVSVQDPTGFTSHIDMVLCIPYTDYSISLVNGANTQIFNQTALLVTWVNVGNSLKRLVTQLSI